MAYSLCSTTVSNTGEQACDKSRGVARKFFIFNGAIAAADYASGTALLAKMVEYSKLSKSATNKIFPINEVQEIADASEANKEGSLGLGFKAVLLEGRPAYTAKIFAGADLLKRLRRFNGQTVRLIEYDANGVIWGTKSGTDFVGFQAKLFFSGNKLATGQNVEEGVANVSISILSNSEYFDNAYYAEVDGNIEDVAGLLDVTQRKVSNVTNVYKVAYEIEGSSVLGAYNIYDEFGSALAALSANFSAKSGASYSTNLPVTSVAVDATLKCLTVTFDSATYTALAAATPIKLSGPTPAQLDAADIPNTEIIDLFVTK